MPRMNVDNLRNDLEVARSYMFEILFPRPIVGDAETLMLRGTASTLPERSLGKIHVAFKQSAGVNFVGKIKYPQTLDITFLEGEDREILKTFYRWMNSIIDDKTFIGRPDFKINFYINLLNLEDEVTDRYKVVGAWPEKLSGPPIDWNTEENIKYSVSFSYDKWLLVEA